MLIIYIKTEEIQTFTIAEWAEKNYEVFTFLSVITLYFLHLGGGVYSTALLTAAWAFTYCKNLFICN